eukprot:9705182-Alexandrium_andersonii.AAC.1
MSLFSVNYFHGLFVAIADSEQPAPMDGSSAPKLRSELHAPAHGQSPPRPQGDENGQKIYNGRRQH